MNINQLKPSTRNATNLIINKNVVLHIVPDFGSKAVDSLHDLGLNLSSCYGLIIKTGILKIGGKSFNATKVYHDSKSKLTDHSGTGTKNVRIIKTIPKRDTIGKNKYLIVDHSITSQATKYISNITTAKRGLLFLTQQLKQQYVFIKKKLPNFENYVLFLTDPYKVKEDNDKIQSLMQLVEKFRTVNESQKKIDLGFFDVFTIDSLKVSESGYVHIPIIKADDKGKPVVIKPNLLYCIKEFKSKAEGNIDSKNTVSVIVKSDDSEATKNEKGLKKLADAVEIKDDKVRLNSARFNKVIKEFKITDPIVSDQIKKHIESYLDKNKEVIDQEHLEFEILKAVNKLVHGTEEVSDKYLHNPADLFLKLQDNKNFQKRVVYPPTRTEYIFKDFDKILDLKYVTAPVKKEIEFSKYLDENVKELFSILEKRTDNPIKIKKIKRETIDNNIHRAIRYTITLQNLTGPYKEPYDVRLVIPSLVNDKYFKLNGKEYILANQIFFKPLTKTAPDECRLLSNYAIVTEKIVNMRFNMSDFQHIIEYIEVKYPKLIDEISKSDNGKIEWVRFKDSKNTTISPSDDLIIQSDDELVVLDHDDNKLYKIVDGEKQPLKQPKYEYIFDKLINIIQEVNKSDELRKSPKSIPYIQIHIGGDKIPLILYLWQQIGLIKALQKIEVDFTIGDKPEHDNIGLAFELENNKKLFIYPQYRRQQLIINGLLTIPKQYKFSSEDISKPSSIDEYLTAKGSTRTINNLNLLTENMIDPITKKLLEYENYPTDMINLTAKSMVYILLNKEPTKLTDLSNYRVRQSEIMFNLMYKQISQAHSKYSQELAYGNPEPKLFLTEDYIIQCMLGVHPHTRGNAVLTLASPFNPIAELKDDTKLIKTGPTGIPNKRSIAVAHRNIHDTHIGNISANSTPESADVGVVTHHSLSAMMNNLYGIYGQRDIEKLTGWDVVAPDEAFVPFVNSIDPQRAVLAITHQAQATPINDGEEPLLTTGFDHVLPQLASSKFCLRAEEDGQVIEVVEDKYLKAEYKSGRVVYFDLTPRLSRNKRATYLAVKLKHLKPGDKFKKNQLVAWSSAFGKNGDTYSPGKNVKLAIMNYMGSSFEDGYVISNKMAKSYKTTILKELTIIVPFNAKVTKFISTPTETKTNDTLVEFEYLDTIDNYLNSYNILGLDMGQEDLEPYRSTGRKVQLKSPGGKILHLKIFINGQNKVDPQIIKAWKEIVKDLRKRKALYSKNYVKKDDKLKAIDNLDMSQIKVGTHKHNGIEFDGAKIVYYIEVEKSLEYGDKLSNRFGAKGVVTKIIDDDNVPTAEFSGEINCFLAPASIIGRKNFSIIKELYIQKIIYYLQEITAKKAAQSSVKTQELKHLILDVYKTLDPSPNKKYAKAIEESINSYSDSTLRRKLKDKKIKFILVVEPFYNIKFETIKKAADILKIPLEERVYIPELGTYTKHPVPVGVHYMQALEQLSEDYMSIRSTGKYIGITGQPSRGKKNYGGQALGEGDVYNLTSYGAKNILKELRNTRSDDVFNKRELINQIIETGEATLPQRRAQGRTQEVFNIFMKGMGLETV